MEYNEIRALLTLYWEGETSLEEEELLRSFFAENQQGLPADLQEAAPLFGYFAVEAGKEMPELGEDFVREMMKGDFEMKIVKSELSGKEPKVMPRPYQHWMKYAAILLLGVGLTYSARQYKIKEEQGSNDDRMAQALNKADTYEDSKEAYAATKKALELLAKNLNKGTAQAKKIAYFNEATEYIKAD